MAIDSLKLAGKRIRVWAQEKSVHSQERTVEAREEAAAEAKRELAAKRQHLKELTDEVHEEEALTDQVQAAKRGLKSYRAARRGSSGTPILAKAQAAIKNADSAGAMRALAEADLPGAPTGASYVSLMKKIAAAAEKQGLSDVAQAASERAEAWT